MVKVVEIAVTDIHGCLEELNALITEVERKYALCRRIWYFLGDLVDRGPDSRGVVDRVERMTETGEAYCVEGNHERLMTDTLLRRRKSSEDMWLGNGGVQTLMSFGFKSETELNIPDETLRWLDNLPIALTSKYRIFVHAGLMPGVPLEEQDEETLLWIRERWLKTDSAEWGKFVVHGHTPTEKGKVLSEPRVLKNRANMDTCVSVTGVLCAAVFDADLPGGPIDIVRVEL